jgi:hypothetical protein
VSHGVADKLALLKRGPPIFSNVSSRGEAKGAEEEKLGVVEFCKDFK